jgi:AcrR family transcriptional regulator
LAELTKRQLQGVESRERVLDAAESLMASRGVAGTSMSALTKASGLPASSIYWHFGSKDGVLVAVMERGAERFFASLAPPESFTGSAEERVRAQLDDTARALEEHGDFLQLLLGLLFVREDGNEDALEVIASLRSEARDRIEAMLVAAGAGRQARRLIPFVLAMIDGAFVARVEDPDVDLHQLFEQLSGAITALASDS